MHAHYYTLIVIGVTFLTYFCNVRFSHSNAPRMCVWGGGGELRFSYIYVGWDHFGLFKILNFNIFAGFQNNHYFWGYEDFVDISLQIWTGFRGHFYTFQGCFLRSMCRMGILFGVAQNYKYFLGSG